jgi:hypothetical protein
MKNDYGRSPKHLKLFAAFPHWGSPKAIPSLSALTEKPFALRGAFFNFQNFFNLKMVHERSEELHVKLMIIELPLIVPYPGGI